MIKHRSVLGIDPGKRLGWAQFFDGRLVTAGACKLQDFLDAPLELTIAPVAVIIEVPRIYRRGGKGDANDLIDLAVAVGDLRGFYARRGCTVQLVTPMHWKGQVPKPIHNKRVLAWLSAEERARLPKRPRAKTYDHNMVDAVGLALFQLQREQQR